MSDSPANSGNDNTLHDDPIIHRRPKETVDIPCITAQDRTREWVKNTISKFERKQHDKQDTVYEVDGANQLSNIKCYKSDVRKQISKPTNDATKELSRLIQTQRVSEKPLTHSSIGEPTTCTANFKPLIYYEQRTCDDNKDVSRNAGISDKLSYISGVECKASNEDTSNDPTGNIRDTQIKPQQNTKTEHHAGGSVYNEHTLCFSDNQCGIDETIISCKLDVKSTVAMFEERNIDIGSGSETMRAHDKKDSNSTMISPSSCTGNFKPLIYYTQRQRDGNNDGITTDAVVSISDAISCKSDVEHKTTNEDKSQYPIRIISDTQINPQQNTKRDDDTCESIDTGTSFDSSDNVCRKEEKFSSPTLDDDKNTGVMSEEKNIDIVSGGVLCFDSKNGTATHIGTWRKGDSVPVAPITEGDSREISQKSTKKVSKTHLYRKSDNSKHGGMKCGERNIQVRKQTARETVSASPGNTVTSGYASGDRKPIRADKTVEKKRNRFRVGNSGLGNIEKTSCKSDREQLVGDKTHLHVLLNEIPSSDVDIGSYFWNRMSLKPGSDMSFNILKEDRADSNFSKSYHVVVSFASYTLASRACRLLTKDNSSPRNTIQCFFDEHEALRSLSNTNPRHQTTVESNMGDIIKTATDTLGKHDKKLREASEQLEKAEAILRRKGLSVHEFSRVTSEKDARDDRLRELELQRKEFTSYVKCMRDKLDVLVKTGEFSSQIREVRKSFGVECRRLESALPMYARRDQILNVISHNKVCVIIGETGSGKSTQMAQYIYQSGIAGDGLIACTQPRKIAAVSLATHVASELASSVGKIVGYQVGMKSKKTADTKIMYMTDDKLLKECLRDDNLEQYSCIIIDEAHERSVYTDLLLGMLKKCLERRQNLKVIVTSATINPDIFVKYFGGNENCPVLQVSGRAYPVQCIYDVDTDFNSFPDNYERKAVDTAIEIHKSQPISDGGILIFMTSPLETEKSCANFQRRVTSDDHVCLQLHGKLQLDEQQAVFQTPPKGKRKIIFATNSAETSITIPGVKFVVDTGVVKEMRFDSKKGMNSLNVVSVSQSSANQRMGRAGRTAPGICYRLYSLKDFESMSKNGKPEILRIHLGQGLLTLLELGVDPSVFDFVESPHVDAIENAMHSLRCIGAVSGNEITENGRWLAKMPVEPRLGVLIKLGIDCKVPIEGIVVAACCTSPGIFFRAGSNEEKKKADLRKIRFSHQGGDLLTMLNVYREWNVMAENKKGTWCRDNSINGKSMKVVREMVTDVLSILRREMKLDIKHEMKNGPEVDVTVQNLIFQSMKWNMCYYLGHERAGYITCERQQHVRMHPSSAVLSLGMNPTWVVFGQLVQTSDAFITNITPVSESLVDQAISEYEIHVDREMLENQEVSVALKAPIGRYVNWKFVGPMHRNRRQLEETMSMELGGSLVVIESDTEQGCVELFTVAKHKQGAKYQLLKELSEIAKPLLNESREENIGNDKSGVRAVIQSGISVRDILLPEQYRVVNIKHIESSQNVHTEASVSSILSQYGTVEYVTQSTGKQQRIFWGRAAFVNAADAATATQDVNSDDTCDIQLVPITIAVRKSGTAEFTLKLNWCRRPARGICYVYLERPEDQVRLQTASPLRHDEHMIEINENTRGESALFIKGLAANAKENDLKQTLADAINVTVDNNDNRFKLIIPREHVAIGVNEINEARQKIANHITSDTAIDPNSFKIDIREYKAQTAHVTAFVTFRNAKDCQDAVDCFGHGFKIRPYSWSEVQATMDLRTSFHVRQNVYAVTKTEIEHYIARRKESGSSSTYSIKILRSGHVVIEINSISPNKLAKARLAIQELVDGDVLDSDGHSNLSYLFTRDGRQHIQQIEKRSATAIWVDQRIQVVNVHGSKTARRVAVDLLLAYIKQMEEAHQARVCLKGRDNPPGMMKHLIGKYGVNLDGLKHESRLQSVSLNVRSHVISLSGTEENVVGTVAVIDKLRSELACLDSEPQSDKPDCPICLCPVDIDVCRLEYCGHAYCKVCLSSLVVSTVNDKKFPINCAAEGCEKELVVRDLNNQIGQGSVNRKTVTAAVVNCFVGQNKNTFRYCITPDCEMVYRVSSNGTIFACTLCQTRICTTCHIQYHDGLTCAMYNSVKNGGDETVDTWINRNPTNRKRCPKCNVVIEKIDGCNHMTCKCGVHICWLCLAVFSKYGDCYGHLENKHGSFI